MSTYLILGGTGKTGRRLITQLVGAGHHVRAASRHPAALSAGVTPTRFDWDDPGSHALALEGVEGVYVVPPALRLDHAPLIGALAERAAAAGTRRLVLLSARGADQSHDNPLAQAERALAQGSGATAWTVVRPAWFAQNFTESFFAPGIASDGVIVAPTGDGAQAFVDVGDIAAVAAAALTGDGHAGRAYDLSGPRALTFAEVADVISTHAGRPVRHVDVPGEQWVRDAVQQAGLPRAYAQVLGALFDLIRAGQDDHVSGGVREALGREAIAFEDWAAREAGALRAPAAA